MQDLATNIAALLPMATGNPAALLQLARRKHQDGDTEAALMLCRQALALAPHDAELTAKVGRFLSETVPRWHFLIVRDVARNAAYDAALRRAIGPGARVLEIGAGTGLLAMMSARAGAAKVMTCEMNPTIAAKAREIIADNGYADRVRVVPNHSEKVDAELDLGGLADILVSEIVSNNLLSEDVLPTHEDAVRRLLKPGGRVIPARGSIRVALAEDTRYDEHRLDTIEGFDLSAFNTLKTAVVDMPVGHQRLHLRGEASDLFSFDFSSGTYLPPGRTTLTCRSDGGCVNGVAQWIALDMDAETRYENRPGPGATSNWAVLFYRFACPIETTPGQVIQIAASHDRHDLHIWCDDHHAIAPARAPA